VLEGDQLPIVLKHAITEASTHQSICKITHGDHQAVIISAMWIPLIMKLGNEKFKKSELLMLMQKLVDARSTKESSMIIVNWAKELR